MVALAQAGRRRDAHRRDGARDRAARHGVRIETDRGAIEAGHGDRRRRPMDEAAAARSAGAAARHAPGDGVVCAARSARRSPPAASRCSCSKAGTACTTAFRRSAASAVKVAKHHHADEAVDPDRCDRTVSAADEALIRPAIADHIPAANGALLAAKTCLYTVTPDGDFIIDRLPVRRTSSSHRPAPATASSSRRWSAKSSPISRRAAATRHDISRFRLAQFR